MPAATAEVGAYALDERATAQGDTLAPLLVALQLPLAQCALDPLAMLRREILQVDSEDFR